MSTLSLLNDIALATLTAAKLVLRSASAAGLDLDANPEVLASIEAMSDQTALQHLDEMASKLLGAAPSDSDPEQLPGRAAHVLGQIMLLLGRSRAAVAGDSRREAHEDLAQILAMMALSKVLFALLEGQMVTSNTLPAGNEALGSR